MVSRRHGWEEAESGVAVAPGMCRDAVEHWNRHPLCITELWRLASQSGRLWLSKAWLFNNTDLPGVVCFLWLISKHHLSAFSEALHDLEHYGTPSMSCLLWQIGDSRSEELLPLTGVTHIAEGSWSPAVLGMEKIQEMSRSSIMTPSWFLKPQTHPKASPGRCFLAQLTCTVTGILWYLATWTGGNRNNGSWTGTDSWRQPPKHHPTPERSWICHTDPACTLENEASCKAGNTHLHCC